MHYLYVVKNKINNKVYIGQSNKENERWRQHKYYAKNLEKTKQYIHRAMNKHGIENFVYEVIATSQTQEDANETEKELIKQYDSRNPKFGYNMVPGGGGLGSGENHPCYGKKQSEETVNKRVESRKGYFPTEETKEKVRQSLIGKKHTNERKEKISRSHLGKSVWNKGTKNIMKSNSGSFNSSKPAPNKGRKRIIDEYGNIKYIKATQ